MCGVDAAFCQITLTILVFKFVTLICIQPIIISVSIDKLLFTTDVVTV